MPSLRALYGGGNRRKIKVFAHTVKCNFNVPLYHFRFLDKAHTVWKTEKFTLIWKIFREINLKYALLVEVDFTKFLLQIHESKIT